MSDIAKTATDTIQEPISWAKKNPWAMALLILVVLVLVLRSSGSLQAKIKARADAAGNKGIWQSLGKFTGAVVTALAIVLLGGVARAFAGLDSDLSGLGDSIVGVGAMATMIAFPSPNFLAMRGESSTYTEIITPGSAPVGRKFTLNSPRETFKGFPMKVSDVTFKVQATVTQPEGNSLGFNVFWGDLFRITNGLHYTSPRFGTVADKEDLTGMVWKHFVEYCSMGYAFSGDDPTSSVENIDGAYVVNIFHNYPIMQRYLRKPEETARFVGWMQGDEFEYRLAEETCLNSVALGATIGDDASTVSVSAGFRFFTGAMVGDVRGAYQVPPLAYHRVLKIPCSGQIDYEFKNISATGPQNTTTVDGERLVQAWILSRDVGGAGDFNDVEEVGCESLGQLNTENPDQYVLAKLPEGRPNAGQAVNCLTPLYIGATGYPTNANAWPYTGRDWQAPRGQVLRTGLMGFPIHTTQVGAKITKMPRIGGSMTVRLKKHAPDSTPGAQQKMYLCTLRDVDGTYACKMLAEAGITGETKRVVGFDAEGAVKAGSISPSSLVGTPIATVK